MKTLLPGFLFCVFMITNSFSKDYETAVVGAGCFWCVEGVYQNLDGVKSVVSGFAGGTKPNPTYDEVTSGTTGHAEVVRIEFDPEVVSYEKILELFWQIHDPTDPRGVWPDFGPMYRSIVLPENEEQMRVAVAAKAAAQKAHEKPIATEIKLLETFYPAENYHQDFVDRNPNHPYVRQIAVPKMKKSAAATKAMQTAQEPAESSR